MNKKKRKILKTIITKGFGFNSDSISESFSEVGLVFFGALLGGVVSLSLSTYPAKITEWLLLIAIFFSIAMLFKIIKHRELIINLIKSFRKS